ncbi:MAG: phosphatidate cytidylyltransferase [Planctomycetes bacterium]|nr:phosphatidate cytidylyltransferase [Planctomycetota bacterium]
MLRQRLIFGSLIALLVVALMSGDAWLAHARPVGGDFGRWLCNGSPSTLLLVLFALLSTRELTRFANQRGYRPLRFVTYVFSVGLVVGPYLAHNVNAAAPVRDQNWGVFWLTLALATAFFFQAVRRGLENAMGNLSSTMFITFYVGLLGYMPQLRLEVGGLHGSILLLYSVFVVKMTDVGAYFTGMLLGRTKFIPWLSPKKTWEGVIGGVIIAVACAVTVGGWLAGRGLIGSVEPRLLLPVSLAVFGFVMAFFSIAGDLFESLLKRDAALKDSGTMIPGMGGILDILDSPLLAAPIAWFYWTQLPMLM